MTEAELVTCLTNVLSIAGTDNNLAAKEEQAIEKIRIQLSATKKHLQKAVARIYKGDYKITHVGRFSDQVRNVEDMLFVAMADGKLGSEEKKEIISFAKSLGLTQKQINRILAETNKVINPKKSETSCPKCKSQMPEATKFCTNCGAKMT